MTEMEAFARIRSVYDVERFVILMQAADETVHRVVKEQKEKKAAIAGRQEKGKKKD